MSIDTDPSLYDFSPPANDCTLCYPANQTPDSFFITVSGVKKGDDWLPTLPEPPNGTFEMLNVGNCNWIDFGTPHLVVYWTQPTFSQINISWSGLFNSFSGTNSSNCIKTFASLWTTPVGNYYWDGQCTITSVIGNGPNDLPALMGLVTLEPEKEMWSQGLPQSGVASTNRYTSHRRDTNILVQYDLT